MPKSFNTIIGVILFFFCVNNLVAQKKVEYKDVLLNGKPAKLNVATGEFILESGDTIYTGKEVNKMSKPQKSKNTADTIRKKEREIQKVALIPETKGESSTDFHIVKSGETLFSLAKRYNAALADLKKANNLETTLIRVGQKLRVKNFSIIESENNSEVWTVSKGDTLYSIAKKNGTTVDSLKKLNNLDGNTINIGQVLRLR